jgi:hypothetical protein
MNANRRGLYRFLDLSGFMASGKLACSELIKEFDGYLVPEGDCEFELIRIQGGIRDLENALVHDWSPIRADSAIRKFKFVVRRLGRTKRWGAPASWLAGMGNNYEDYYKGAFFPLAQKYLQHLVEAEWMANWPYPLVDISDYELIGRRILARVGLARALDFKISLADGDQFLTATQEFLESLLATRAEQSTRVIVTHNAFEPFNPMRATRYFCNAKCIIVDRDPRDSFFAMSSAKHMALGVDDFIARFARFRKEVRCDSTEAGIVLRIRFEDLVLDYNSSVKKILYFLGEHEGIHLRKQAHFDPSRAINSIAVWKQYSDRKQMNRIGDALRVFCDPRCD